MARSPLSFITGPTRATLCVAHTGTWLKKSWSDLGGKMLRA
jgi:hypothetical protein